VNIVAFAGNDTTKRLIGWIGKTLSDHPGQLRLLAEDRSLVPNAVEEVLRYNPTSLQSGRWVTEDVEFHGQTVPKDSIIMLLLASANRDERNIHDPDRFDITREPGQIMTFGWGIHYCLGQNLARLELRIVLDEVMKRFSHWEVDMDNAVFVADDMFRGWDALPVASQERIGR
jgi:cytochrome P450